MNQTDIIKSVYDNQQDILNAIKLLYCTDGFDCDPTFSKGVFYKGTEEPKYKLDLAPQRDDVWQCDCRKLPFPNEYLGSVVFDPPFIGASKKDGKPGIIKERFSYFSSIPVLWNFYNESLSEFYRVLALDGVLVFKCQDSIESGKQYISHVAVMNMALHLGFYAEDLFILTAQNRLISPSQWNQQHARKYHSYFWVFRKSSKRMVEYP